ncbi:tripartite tricarboxylate transporter TctB family protein [Halomonas cupida]|uniref:Tripartite tricarboxylate transporter TctB family protein n=1 Tax=Halomonas cupida TaxID=44933 RepID=A0A1M7AA01_9GAMM|nr:tripartite tricarboxylate transporter TctB family protein [Halomonas cupida]SHL39537.1 Tripartite tricarboxylate transporter TctB family protein [Halomonas cupida]
MRDLLIGLGFILAGIVTIVTAQKFPTLPSLQFGPSLFPSLIGGGFCIGGLALSLSQLNNIRLLISRCQDMGIKINAPRKLLTSLLPAALIVFYILSSDFLGTLLTMFIIMFSLMMIRKTRFLIAFSSSAILSAVIYFLFSHYLLIPLPQGTLFEGSL